jgi:ADP-ribosylglycohydrolase
MSQQPSLFGSADFQHQPSVEQFEPPKSNAKLAPSVARFEGALVGSAIGDALGWPVEFWKRGTSFDFDTPLRKYVSWSKNQGGSYGWGYTDQILAGSYSDDTQLSLAVARCIDEKGSFEPERFAYSEFPLWLHYERGGGRTIKKAAHKLLQKRTVWNQNFFRNTDGKGTVDYRTAGANGAAMRVLPLVLANPFDSGQLTSDVFSSSIITHGHPRALLGAWLIAYAIQFALSDEDLSVESLTVHLWKKLRECHDFVRQDAFATCWINDLNKSVLSREEDFLSSWNRTLQEVREMLDFIEREINGEPEHFYRSIGAFDFSTKGSGTVSAGAAIFQFLHHRDSPNEAIFSTANMLGSDTDTIGAMLGALVGARFGYAFLPPQLSETVQDKSYLLKTAQRLHHIAIGENNSIFTASKAISKTAMLQKLLAWEIGLHEMFWDAIGEGDHIHHPALGRGLITAKETKILPNAQYVAKLISINFDCGQTCVFHARVRQADGEINESLTNDLVKSLY